MKPLCTAPFTDFGIAAESYSSCCMSYIRYNDTDATSALNNKTITDVREAMIEHRIDDLPDTCKRCISTKFNEKFDDETAVISSKIIVDDIRNLILYPSNECAGACLMCGDEFSRTYSTQYNRENVRNIDNIDECIQMICDVKAARSVRILGGNIQDMMRGSEIMSALVESNVDNVTIVTNGSSDVMRDGSFFFDHVASIHESGTAVRLVISIDGVEEVNNLQRRLINYKRLNRFIEAANDHSAICESSLLATITLYNVERFHELTALYERIGVGFISMPFNMSIANAHPEFLDRVIDIMKSAPEHDSNTFALNELLSFKKHLKFSHTKWSEFCHETYQKVNREDLKKSSPILYSFMQNTLVL